MTDDLVKRLREVKDWWREPGRTAEQAADRIEKLEHDLLVVLGMLSERLPAAEKCEMAYEYLLARAALGEKK